MIVKGSYPAKISALRSLSSFISALKVSSGCKPPADFGVLIPLFPRLDLPVPPELKKLEFDV